jgi:hypothetical protein
MKGEKIKVSEIGIATIPEIRNFKLFFFNFYFSERFYHDF